MTDPMLSWLRSTIEAEKALAEAASPGPWSANAESDEVVAVDGITVADGFALSGRQLRATVDHIALHHPQDTIARCEADLTILDRVLPEARRADVQIANEFGAGWPDDELSPTEELLARVLAHGYRHRPGWLPEWAPEGATQ